MKLTLKLSIIFLFLTSCTNTILEIEDRDYIKVDAPQVSVVGEEHEDYFSFKGIPYAQPPVGDLRWKAPVAYSSSEVVDGSKFKNECVQPKVESSFIDRRTISGNEDCLYLNIYVPKNNVDFEKNDLPVMFWIHGGSNIWGSGSSYDFSNLARKRDVIVVTINYRLGVFGWFSSDFIRETSSGLDKTSNFGHLDIIEALNWTNRNIKSFGGNPDNITVFGESAGGHNVLTLLASPLAKGLFEKAISQSGYVQTHSVDFATKNSELSSEKIFEEDIKYLTDTQEIVSFLRNLSSEQVYNKYISTAEADPYPITPISVRDDIVIPKEGLYKSLENIDPNLVVIAGTNRDEMNYWYIRSDYFFDTTLDLRRSLLRSEENFKSWNKYRSDIWRYRGAEEPLRRMAKSNANLYSYRFDWDEQRDGPLGDYSLFLGAAHGLEIPFIAQTFNMEQIPWYVRPILFPDSSAASRNSLSEQMMTFWSNIAKYGNPNAFGKQKNWEKFSLDSQAYLRLDNPNDNLIQMVNDPVNPVDLINDLKSDSTLEIKERCLLGWIAVRQFSEFENPDPPYNFCSDFSEEQLSLFRREVEGAE